MQEKYKYIKNGLLIINLILFYYLMFIGRNQYLYDMSYLKCILFMFFNCLFIFMYGVLKNSEKEYKFNVVCYLILYCILLFVFTFLIGRSSIRFSFNWGYAELRVFHTIISQYKRGSMYSFCKNILGNAVALIPMSFLLMIKDKKFNNLLKQFLIIFPSILLIEVFQGFTHVGSFDVDDIILNYFGTVLFTFLITRFGIIDKIRKVFYWDFKLSNKLKLIMFYSSMILLIIFDILIFI